MTGLSSSMYIVASHGVSFYIISAGPRYYMQKGLVTHETARWLFLAKQLEGDYAYSDEISEHLFLEHLVAGARRL